MLFFELLQVAIGNRTMLSHTPTEEEWRELYALAQKQTLVGIAFRGVEQLPEAQRPPKALLMQWYMNTERIKVMNADLNGKAIDVADRFLDDGFPNVILKGQGIAKLYQVERIENSKLKIENCQPGVNDTNYNDAILNNVKNLSSGSTARSVRSAQDDKQDGKSSSLSTVNGERSTDGDLSIVNCQLSLRNYRTPGDIDIWLHGGRKEILNYVRKYVPDCKPVYHHVDFPAIDGLDIEVHFTPSWMNSPITNRRLQRWFRENRDYYPLPLKEGECIHRYKTNQKELSPFKGDERREQSERSGGGRKDTSTNELPVPSLAFNRVYILVHIYRHLFHEGIGLRQLLDYYFVLHQGFTLKEREETMRTLRSLKMQCFTAAVMWVLQEVYGMDDRYLLTTPDEHEGRFLLNEIMLAGNFGYYDERLQYKGESSLGWALRKVKRNFRFVRSYPSEVLWSPIFKLWHYVWRKFI